MNDCIIHQGSTTSFGYGRTLHKGKMHRAHRLVWMLANGPIPKGMQVCHHCDIRKCINIDHLFLGTNSDNQRDSVRKGRQACIRKTHCKHGHEFTEENTYMRPDRGGAGRICIQCRRETDKRRRKRGR